MKEKILEGNELELSLLGLRIQKIIEGVRKLHGLKGEDIDLFMYDLTMTLNNEFKFCDVEKVYLGQRLDDVPKSIYAMMPDYMTTSNMKLEDKFIYFKIASPHRKYEVYGLEKFSDNKEKFAALVYDRDDKVYFETVLELSDLKESNGMNGFPYSWERDFSPCKVKDLNYANELLMDRLEGRRKPDIPFKRKETNIER